VHLPIISRGPLLLVAVVGTVAAQGMDSSLAASAINGDGSASTSILHHASARRLQRPGTTSLLATGQYCSCSLISVGSVSCWGMNFFGQLGVGTTTSSTVPLALPVLGTGSAVSVAMGSSHACAVLTGGGLKCWGRNLYGQLGVGYTTESPSSNYGVSAPTAVNLGADVTAVSAGAEYTCALLLGGNVSCWGLNDMAQLGDESKTNSSNPLAVALGTDVVVGLAAGNQHVCVVARRGRVLCWGSNDHGQLAAPLSITRSGAPQLVQLAGAAAAVASGSSHTCALLASGNVSCWGGNANGQLGIRNNLDTVTPTAVDLPGAAVSLSTRRDHTCALLNDGSVYCWGQNDKGQLGIGTIVKTNKPQRVQQLAGPAVAVACGSTHTCVALSDGSAYCWGENTNGELGVGSTTSTSLPTQAIQLGADICPNNSVANGTRCLCNAGYWEGSGSGGACVACSAGTISTALGLF